MHKSGLVHVVDDNADIRRMLALVLESQGYTVRVHDGGEAYLNADPSQAPHVMLLDVRMPGMSGLELHAKLKASGNDIPVIFMSGESQAHETQAANSLGAVHFLWKPFNTQEMLTVIDKVLTGKPVP
ncbi:response regulator transcription factor [Limnohabitans sp. T6-20]|uniref:response regulator transcription factor n=1 Tax=Limnohabitans sp. T6-20 TaxID=1100725 RepID=UPI001304F1FB|nr:response regulator [Limnohabitans sp. T6-20]